MTQGSYTLLSSPNGGSTSLSPAKLKSILLIGAFALSGCILLLVLSPSNVSNLGQITDMSSKAVLDSTTTLSEPMAVAAAANGQAGFPRRGVKYEVWKELDAIENWEFTINPQIQTWKRERNPKVDEPYWTTKTLLGHEHDLPVFPVFPTTPKNASRLESMLFSFVTTAGRARKMSDLWQNWMVSRNPAAGTPNCLVMLSAAEKNETEPLTQYLREKGLNCDVTWSTVKRYEVRVLTMIKEMPRYARRKGLNIDWYVWNDDDTLWLDQATLRRMLAKYDPADSLIIGATSEAAHQMNDFGRMAFGGAGIMISRALLSDMERHYGQCWEKFRHYFGGDEMVTRCAALTKGDGWTKSTVTTEEPGLHQFDIPGDTTGVLQSGLPFLNLHHMFGGYWVHLFAYGKNYMSDMDKIKTVQKAAIAIGGDNMFERYIFDDGKWLLVNGHSLVYYEEPLQREWLRTAEHTWYADYRLSIDDRPEIPERRDDRERSVKQSFYIEDVIMHGPASEMARTGIEATLIYASSDKWDEEIPKEERKLIKMHWRRTASGTTFESPRDDLKPKKARVRLNLAPSGDMIQTLENGPTEERA